MTDPDKTPVPPRQDKKKSKQGEPVDDDHEMTVEEMLDEGLEETFPASDSPSVTRGGGA